MITAITLNGQPVNLVSMPGAGAGSSLEWGITDAVGMVASSFTGQVQTQSWPGAEGWTATLTLPPMYQADADPWIAMLMEMRGIQNAVQLADPRKNTPRGTPAGTPAVDGSAADAAMAQVLHTTGWAAGAAKVLLPNDRIQVGYRVYAVLGAVDADGGGNAAISIWPSLREAPAAGAPVITSNCSGLFRLAANKRNWSAEANRTTRLSVQLMEYR